MRIYTIYDREAQDFVVLNKGKRAWPSRTAVKNALICHYGYTRKWDELKERYQIRTYWLTPRIPYGDATENK